MIQNQKTGSEANKEVWILKNQEGDVVGKFRSKELAKKEKKRREKFGFGIILNLERDNSYRR